MKRREILAAVDELKQALLSSRLHEILGGRPRDKGEDKSVTDLLTALKDYAIRAHSFKPATKQLTKIFQLDELETPDVWLNLAERTPPVLRLRQRIRDLLDYLPEIAEMIEPESLSRLKDESRQRIASEHRRVLTVTVYEPDTLFSSPLRLANVLQSITDFYTACALMAGESPSTLSVISCDSGSDKSFDFLGLAKVMECVQKLIETIWDRAFFFREHQFDVRLDLVTKSLPIIERIKTMEKEKLIEPELAQILTRHVFEGTNKFLVSGATIPHIEDTSSYNPKALLSPVQKLLVAAPAAPNPSEKQAESGEGETLPNLTSEEREKLFQLLSKSRGDGSQESPAQEQPVEPAIVNEDFYEGSDDMPE